jgi:hypothetical protein
LEGLAELDDEDVVSIRKPLAKIAVDKPTLRLVSSRKEESVPRFPIAVSWEDNSSDEITLDLTPALRACHRSGVMPILSKVACDDAMSVYLAAFSTST